MRTCVCFCTFLPFIAEKLCRTHGAGQPFDMDPTLQAEIRVPRPETFANRTFAAEPPGRVHGVSQSEVAVSRRSDRTGHAPLPRIPAPAAYSPSLDIKKPRPGGQGLKWCIAIGIEVWGLPVMSSNTPSTVNSQAKHTFYRLKRCECIVDYL